MPEFIPGSRKSCPNLDFQCGTFHGGSFSFIEFYVTIFSVTGNILAVSGGDNHVSLWRESPDGTWNSISEQSEVEAS